MLKPRLYKLKPTTDPTYDLLRSEASPLGAFFRPKCIAVIGATDRDGSVGKTVLWNLIRHPFGGTVFPINPKRKSVLGVRAYPTVSEAPEEVDLALVVTPAATVPKLVKECVDVNVRGVIILSAGFKEIGEKGIELEKEILAAIASSETRVIGPNCLGLMNPLTGLNASFAGSAAKPGNVGFISQSGALCTAVLDWSLEENVGFSAFVSVGSMLDVNWGDLIYYLGDDPLTHSIVIYMETVGNARMFLSAAREVALTKPIIVIKAGRTTEAANAAASHTGSLAGSDAVLDAAFKRCGVLRVNTIAQLFDLAEVLSKQGQKLPSGPRLTIITNAGGPGVLATDALVTAGAELSVLSDTTVEQLNTFLPPAWSHSNPIDILGDADPERYVKALETCANDTDSDGLLVILTPQAMTNATSTAEQLKNVAQHIRKPVLASWMGGPDVMPGISVLNKSGIPTYQFPDAACEVYNFMWRYKHNLQALYETPALSHKSRFTNYTNGNGLPLHSSHPIVENALNEGRTILTELESKQLLKEYNIPTVQSLFATTAEEAATQAESIGFPVVAKLVSKTITHKTDVGGVKLNISSPEEVHNAFQSIRESVVSKFGEEQFEGVSIQPMVRLGDGYELIIGSSVDLQFGPVMLFGSGGSLVEVFQDRSIMLPPLTSTLAKRMMESTKIYTALKGVRGRASADLPELEHLLVRFSEMIVENPRIKEFDINPLLVYEASHPSSILALDARAVLYPAEVSDKDLPKTAIRPYPSQYISKFTLDGDEALVIRPIRPEDEKNMVDFHQTLSEESVYFRFFHSMKLDTRVAHERLTRICFVDYDREIALVIERETQEEATEIIAACRLSRTHEGVNEAEFSMLITDKYQRKGLGTELLKRMIEIGRHEKIERIIAHILPENAAMQRVCEKAGFKIAFDREADYVRSVLTLL